jgi:hypothetical protein
MKSLAFVLALAISALAAVADLPPETLAQAGHPKGGTSFTLLCPRGSVLAGIRLRKASVINAIGIKCRSVAADGSLGADSNVTTFAGGDGGMGSAASCPKGSVITGSAGVVASPDGLFGFVFECRQWNAAMHRWSGPSISAMGIPAAQAALVGNLASPNLSTQAGFSTYRSCSHEPQPAHGIAGRAGSFVVAVGLVCDEP